MKEGVHMNRNHKIIIIHVVGLLVLFIILILFSRTIIFQNKRLPIPADAIEEHLDKIVDDLVHSEPYIMKKVLFGSEDIAKKYAKILYLENYGGWNYELDLWVKHYKEFGVWLAMFRSDDIYLEGPPIIIFKDTDGQVIWYSR
jgi:hypothetical protein